MIRTPAFRLAGLVLAAIACLAASPKPSSDEGLRQQIRAQVGADELSRLVMQAFPDEYVALENRLVALRKAGADIAESNRQIAEFGKAVTTQIGPMLARAPAPDLLILARDEAGLYEILQPENLKACVALGTGTLVPPAIMAGLSAKAKVAWQTWRIDKMKAVIAARRDPHPRQPLTDADSDWLWAAYRDHGAEQGWIDAVMDGKAGELDDATRCCNNLAAGRAWVDLGGELYGRYLTVRYGTS